MADVIYNSAVKNFMISQMDLDAGDVWAMLVTDAYVPNAAHDFRNDINNEVVGAGYTANGKLLTGQHVDLVGGIATFYADNPLWPDAEITSKGTVLYRKLGGAASLDPLLCYLDFGANKTASGGEFEVLFDPTGICELAKE